MELLTLLEEVSFCWLKVKVEWRVVGIVHSHGFLGLQIEEKTRRAKTSNPSLSRTLPNHKRLRFIYLFPSILLYYILFRDRLYPPRHIPSPKGQLPLFLPFDPPTLAIFNFMYYLKGWFIRVVFFINLEYYLRGPLNGENFHISFVFFRTPSIPQKFSLFVRFPPLFFMRHIFQLRVPFL